MAVSWCLLQLGVRLPKFQDSRKNKASPVFTGWTDDSETGQSPLSSLFSKIVPFMQVATRPLGVNAVPVRQFAGSSALHFY
jgi:hypothetical protein